MWNIIKDIISEVYESRWNEYITDRLFGFIIGLIVGLIIVYFMI